MRGLPDQQPGHRSEFHSPKISTVSCRDGESQAITPRSSHVCGRIREPGFEYVRSEQLGHPYALAVRADARVPKYVVHRDFWHADKLVKIARTPT
jgi:hypothetical protein